MKAWWTARELAEARLPGLPTSERGIQVLSDRSGWGIDPNACRERAGRGGGMEYHRSLFPEVALIELARREASEAAARLPAPQLNAALPALVAAPTTPVPALTGTGQTRMDAKLAILTALDAFVAAHQGRLSKTKAMHLFVGGWNAGMIEAPAAVRAAEPVISYRSLLRWRESRDAGAIVQLAGAYRGRTGTGRWDTALKPVRDLLLALFAERPHLSAVQIRKLVRSQLCDPTVPDDMVVMTAPDGSEQRLALPAVSEFQRQIAKWKQDNPTLYLRLQSPDAFKNRRMLALGDDIGHIVRPNQIWLIDASPQDVLLISGRHTLYLLIDGWSRRVLILVTKTPRTEAVKLLLRRALLAWGVPEEIKTDNGSDFVSREAVRVFAALGIPQVCSDPYCPWQKGMVERAIGTLQHQLYPLLPGYCGANVAQAQALRARKSFSERLGESEREAFEVRIDVAQAQALADGWAAESYGHEPHGGAGMGGLSPAARMASWSGPLKRISDERALDLLLIRATGTRVMGKKGLRCNHRYYYDHALIGREGEELEVRIDPAEPSRAFIWQADPLAFVCVAACLDDMAPADRARVATEGRAKQTRHYSAKTRAVKAAAGRRDHLADAVAAIGFDMVRNRAGHLRLVEPAPVLDVAHSSPGLVAAGRAVRALEPPRPRESTPAELELVARIEAEMAAPTPVPEQPEERFARALALERRLAREDAVTAEERRWLAGYQRSAEYRGYRLMHDDFGDQMLATG